MNVLCQELLFVASIKDGNGRLKKPTKALLFYHSNEGKISLHLDIIHDAARKNHLFHLVLPSTLASSTLETNEFRKSSLTVEKGALSSVIIQKDESLRLL